MPDDSRKQRSEDASDVGAAHAWLAGLVPVLAGPEPEVRQFAGGASILTYRLRYPSREPVLRRPPAGVDAASAHDMVGEHPVQSALAPVYPYVPHTVALCTDHAVLGSDWLAAEQPDDVAMCLVHNDFRLDNLVPDMQLQVVAVLDGEMATVGDPLMDLGGALARRAQVVDHSCADTGVVRAVPACGHRAADQPALRARPDDELGVQGLPPHLVPYLEQRCRRVAGLA